MQRPEHPSQLLELLHRPAQQVQPGLAGLPGLPDGHHHQVGVPALLVAAAAHPDGPLHQAHAVGDVHGLGVGLFGDHVHQHHVPAHAAGRQGIGAVAAHMARPQNHNFTRFHDCFLLSEHKKTPLTEWIHSVKGEMNHFAVPP